MMPASKNGQATHTSCIYQQAEDRVGKRKDKQ